MPNITHEQCKLLVHTFVKDPNWPREIKIAKKLMIEYSLEFLLTIPVKQINSLAFFLTPYGKEKIEQAKKLQKLDF